MTLRDAALLNAVCLIIVFLMSSYSMTVNFLHIESLMLSQTGMLALGAIQTSLAVGPPLIFFLLLRKNYK